MIETNPNEKQECGDIDENEEILENGDIGELSEDQYRNADRFQITKTITSLLFVTGVAFLITIINISPYRGKRLFSSSSLSSPSLDEQKPTVIYQDEKDKKDDFGIDIFVIGFAKTGTSSLLKFMEEDDEVAMLPHENADLVKKKSKSAISHLKSLFDKMPNSATKMKAIKCPSAIRNIRSIETLVKHTQTDTKLVLGVRHPMKFFQSYYNYRVKHLHSTQKSTSHIPPVEDLIGDKSHSWLKLYTELARFELFMKQLAKANVSDEELNEMKNAGLRLVPNSYKVFIYNVEQLGDSNPARLEQFRSDFQHFLGLEKPIPPIPEHNVNHQSFPEYLNVCDDEHKEFRSLMTSQGNATANWIRDRFLRSDDVIVGGEDFFLELLESWGDDICELE